MANQLSFVFERRVLHKQLPELKEIIDQGVATFDVNTLKKARGERVYTGVRQKITLPAHNFRSAHFYDKLVIMHATAMRVLEDAVSVVPLDDCNAFHLHPFVESIRGVVKETTGLSSEAAEYHESANVQNLVTAIYGHKDKVSLSSAPASFVPLQVACYVLIALPHTNPLHRCDDSDFRLWKKFLPIEEREKVEEFVEQFERNCGCHKNKIHIIYLETSDILSFEATKYYHAVIMLSSNHLLRKMLLFYALETV